MEGGRDERRKGRRDGETKEGSEGWKERRDGGMKGGKGDLLGSQFEGTVHHGGRT